MKWFKHDSDASNDAKLKKLRLKYGAQGYGIYWYCLELIARNVEKHNLTFELEHDAELIADDFKLSSDLVQHIMTYMVELQLFENTNGIVSCLKMATRTDEYTQKLLQSSKKCHDNIPTISVESPTKSVLIEEKRIEDIKKEKITKYIPQIPTELLSDYIKVRKAKKAGDLTKTAFEGIEREAKIAGISTEDAVKICCERGWVGFKASWMDQASNDKSSSSWRNDDASIMKKANSLNVYTSGKTRFEILAAIDKKEGRI